MRGQNKINLVKFLVQDWPERITGKLDYHQAVYLSMPNGEATKITSVGSEFIERLECDHEEADSRFVLHCGHFSQTYPAQEKVIIIFSPDIDIAVLCCYHFEALSVDELWLHMPGKQKRFLPIHTSVNRLGARLCGLLPALHCLSGCDFTSSLADIGKKRALRILNDNMDKLENLTNLGSHPTTIYEDCPQTRKTPY